MYEVIGVNGNVLRLDHLPDEEQKKSLQFEITELLEVFGPMDRRLLLFYFSDKYAPIVQECVDSMLRLKRLYEFGNYVTTDPRFFDDASYTVPKKEGQEGATKGTLTFEEMVRKNDYMGRLKFRQKAFAIFLFFRDEVGCSRWFLNENMNKPWLILSFIAREKQFFVVRPNGFNGRSDFFSEMGAADLTANPRETKDRLCIVEEAEKEEEVNRILDNHVNGVIAYVTVDDNFTVTVKKADKTDEDDSDE